MKEAAGQARPYTSAELCSSMTLREMLDVREFLASILETVHSKDICRETTISVCNCCVIQQMSFVTYSPTVRSTGQYSSRPTTQELFQSAPESVSAMRHRLRAERAEAARQSSNVIPSYKQQLSGDEEESEDRVAGSETIMRFTMYGKDRTISTKSIELLDVALDRRPGIPLLVSWKVFWQPCPHSLAHIRHAHSPVLRESSVWC